MEQILTDRPVSGRPPSTRGLRANALMILGFVFAASLVGFSVLRSHLSIGKDALAFAAILLFAIFVLVIRGLQYHHHHVFGAANTVTAIRTAIVSLVTAAVFFAVDMSTSQQALWTLICLVLIALALDGLDGFLARSFAHESALGARFDMEVDALLILVLSIAGFLHGKAGFWILAIGLMRYAFVAAQYALPALAQPLPPSFRRKLICVIQVGALCVILLPVVAPPVSTLIAALALASLCYSFAVDTAYLLKRGEATA